MDSYWKVKIFYIDGSIDEFNSANESNIYDNCLVWQVTDILTKIVSVFSVKSVEEKYYE